MGNQKFFLIGAGVFVILSLGLLSGTYLQGYDDKILEDKIEKLREPELCATVTTQCKARAQTKAKACDLPKPERQLREQLSIPLQSGDCVNSDKTLRAQCPANCKLDPNSTLVVPGKISVSSRPNFDENNCSYLAVRPVTLRANCLIE